jgi:Glycosyl hydrolase family 65, C-terminal domain
MIASVAGGQLIEVEMTHAATTYRLLEGPGLPIRHFGQQLRFSPGAALSRPTAADTAGRDVQDLPRAA